MKRFKKVTPLAFFYELVNELQPAYLLLFVACFFGMPQAKSQSPLKVQFEINNLGFPVKGTFDSLSISYSFDPAKLEQSKFAVNIFAASINTGIIARDRHLQKAKYFDVEQFPILSFQSKNMVVTPTGYRLIGRLTIKGHSEEIQIDVNRVDNSTEGYLETAFQVNRSTFDIGNKSFILGNEVRISLMLML